VGVGALGGAALFLTGGRSNLALRQAAGARPREDLR
jgi:hypothetical protein